MSKKRPDWVKCISHEVKGEQHTSWCGRFVGMEFHFHGVDHAAENGRSEGRLVACPECTAAVIAALKNGAE
jgi:hypothetical protein